MALSYWSFKKYDHLFDDELVHDVIALIEKRRRGMADWIKENDPLENCPSCNSVNIRYEWDYRMCHDCGWAEKYKVPIKGGKTSSRKFESMIKELFASRMGQQKREDKISPADIKYIPIDLTDFDTGEYSDSQVKFLNSRFKEILDIPHVEFSKKDLTIVHFLVLQELKLKELYRLEAVDNNTFTNKDFSKIKKDELTLYTKLEKKLDNIVQEQKKSDDELSILKQIDREFEDKTIEDLIQEQEEKKEHREKKIEESIQRRKETGNKVGNFNE